MFLHRITVKRLCAVLCLISLSVPASASPELAVQWGSKAADLHQATTEHIHKIDTGGTLDLSDDYFMEVERFAVNAARLGGWVDETKGARDLGCILRGMSDEGEHQLITLDQSQDASETREALRRLATMFADAELIAVASTRRYALPEPNRSHGPAACPADPALAYNALN